MSDNNDNDDGGDDEDDNDDGGDDEDDNDDGGDDEDGDDDEDDNDNDDDNGDWYFGLKGRRSRSPGQRPGCWWTTVMFALKEQKLLPIQGVFYIPSSYPGRCPGLVADRLSAILEELRLMARTMTMMGAMTGAGISA